MLSRAGEERSEVSTSGMSRRHDPSRPSYHAEFRCSIDSLGPARDRQLPEDAFRVRLDSFGGDTQVTGDHFPAEEHGSCRAYVAIARRIHPRARTAQDDLDPVSGPKVGSAQIAAFREWEGFKGQRFAELKNIRHPTLVVNGVRDEMIPVSNSYRLSENLANAILLTYPDAGHGSLFQYSESFTRHAEAFLSSNSESAVF
jgi:pimeloyl-ACP methyl ester carboxylesterase